MSTRIKQIADIYYLLHCDNIAGFRDSSIHDEFFYKKSLSENHIIIAVDFVTDQLPDITQVPLMFDSGSSWSICNNGNEYYISHNLPVFSSPSWIAKINSDYSKATIFCGPDIINKNDSGGYIINNPICYPLDQILLMNILIRNAGALIHAAGIEIDGRGFVFAGKSGAGKSTISEQFDVAKKGTLLSDDRVVVRKINSDYIMYGTPWAGEAGIAKNQDAPLSGFFFIRQSEKNRITRISPAKALESILPLISIPWYDKKLIAPGLSFCEGLIENIPMYELEFRPETEIVEVFDRFISQV